LAQFLLLSVCGLLGAHAADVEAKLDDPAVMDDPINGGGGGQGVSKDNTIPQTRSG